MKKLRSILLRLGSVMSSNRTPEDYGYMFVKKVGFSHVTSLEAFYFVTKQEAFNWLETHVAKVNQKDWVLFVNNEIYVNGKLKGI